MPSCCRSNLETPEEVYKQGPLYTGPKQVGEESFHVDGRLFGFPLPLLPVWLCITAAALYGCREPWPRWEWDPGILVPDLTSGLLSDASGTCVNKDVL